MFEDVVKKWTPFLEKRGWKNIRYAHHGKRGVILCGQHGGRTLAIKVPRPSSDALARISIEAQSLEKVNAFGIGPTLLEAGQDPDYIIYEYIEGKLIGDLLDQGNITREDLTLLKTRLLEQCFTLDLLGFTKEEMHHPLKHVIVRDDSSLVLIDFERMHADPIPKNVSQVLQFLSSNHFSQPIDLPVEKVRLYKHTLKNFHLGEAEQEELEEILHDFIDMLDLCVD